MKQMVKPGPTLDLTPDQVRSVLADPARYIPSLKMQAASLGAAF